MRYTLFEQHLYTMRSKIFGPWHFQPDYQSIFVILVKTKVYNRTRHSEPRVPLMYSVQCTCILTCI